MIKPADKNNFTHTVLVAVVLSLAACGREDLPSLASAPHTGDQAVTTDASDLALPDIIERRHFAIYNSYRVLFDDSPQVSQPQSRGQEDEVPQALMHAGSMPACSIRAMLLQD